MVISKTLNKLPIIDFSRDDLNPGTHYWFLIRTKVVEALEEYGCFEAIYHNKVPLELHNQIFDEVKELFDLPLGTKIQNNYDKPYFGYVGPVSERIQEGMGIDDPQVFEQVQSFSNIMWPQGNDHFCEIVYSFVDQVKNLEQMVTKMLFESYGAERYYDSHIESMNYLLKFMKYKIVPCEANAMSTKFGASPHTDKTYLSILHQNHVKGLEVQTKNGEWISVNPTPSSFIVMTGDAFLAWSNGRLRSCYHKVAMKEGEETRYSTGFFGFSRKLVEVPPELVDEEHPLQFRPFNQMDLISFLSTEEGQKAYSTVKAYCGI